MNILEQAKVSSAYLGEFTKTMQELGDELPPELSLEGDDDQELGLYVVEGQVVITDGRQVKVGDIVVRDMFDGITIPMVLHIAPRKTTQVDALQVAYTSVIVPDILTQDEGIDAEILKYVLMLTKGVSLGAPLMFSGRKHLFWQTIGKFGDLTPLGLLAEIGNHAAIYRDFGANIEHAFELIREGHSAAEVYVRLTREDQ